MALHHDLAAHEADPPSSWTVAKRGSGWALLSSQGHVLDRFSTKKAAEAARHSGWLAKMYADEGHWMRGGSVHLWRPYAEIVAERARNAERHGRARRRRGVPRSHAGRLRRARGIR